jgi:RAB protein geranylgeranyltransferase component A
MANPNIVSVSSIKGESMGIALTTTVGTDIMTVSANKLVKINYIQVANDSGTAATDVTVAINKQDFTSDGIQSDEDSAAVIFLASTVSCPADDVLVVIDKPIYLMETDILEAGANPATADIFISYEVIDDA